MPTDPNKYREHLYRYRSHPPEGAGVRPDLPDRRNSFAAVYLSILPFIGLEYFAELYFRVLPSGLVFPVGFVLFWAFFYTYYKPGVLEGRLSNSSDWSLAVLPSLLIGTAFWLVKVTIIGTMQFFLPELLKQPEPQRPRPQPQPRPQYQYRQQTAQQSQQRAYAHQAPPRPQPSRPAPNALPRDIQQALVLLGVENTRSWIHIQRRYRELAKQYHPDLNPEITDVGRRFMVYDSAYRKLCQVKTRYFR